MFLIYAFISVPVNAADWALIRLSGMVNIGSFESGTGFSADNESDWYSFSHSSSISAIKNVKGVSANAMQFSYDIPAQNGLYSGFGHSFNSSDLSSYDSISFWVSGNVKDLKFVLSSEETASVNNYDEYAVSIARFAGKDFCSTYERITIPFSAFAQQGFAAYKPIEDILKKVVAIQVKTIVAGSRGIAEFDEFVFNADTTSPIAHSDEFMLAGATAGTIGSQQVVNGAFSVSVVVDEDSYLKKVSGFSPVYIITPQGKIDPDSVLFTQNSVSSNYVVTSEFSTPIASGLNYGVFFGGALTDGAGNAVTQGGVVTENKILEIAVNDLQPPVVDLVTNLDSYGGIAQVGNRVVVTVNINDSAGFAVGSTPNIVLRDWQNEEYYFRQISYVGTSGNITYVGQIEITDAIGLGPVYVYVENSPDIFGNLIQGYSGGFRVLNVAMGAMSATTVLNVNGADVYNNDFLNEINVVTCGFSSSSTVTSYNIKILDSTSSVVSDTGWLAVGAPGSNVTASHNYGSPLSLSPGAYMMQMVAMDSDSDTVTQSVNFNVSDELVSDVSAAPNPFNPNVGNSNITFYLAESAEVELRIYSISGELQCAESLTGVIGFNRIKWNGRNDFSETVANGVYLAYLIVDNGKEEVVKKLKIAVLK